MTRNLSCLIYAAGDARFEERPIPALEDRPYDVLVKIAYTGVCGSDVHFWKDGGFTHKVRAEDPMIMGHEASGVVSSIGSKVTKMAVGDHVALEPGFPCRRCDFCRDGRYNLCYDMTFAASPGPGPVTHGTLTQCFALPEDFCYKLPSSVGLDEAVLTEPLAVAAHAVRLIGIQPGQNVIVMGAGTVGLLSCAVAREFGAAKVVSVDVNPDRLHFSQSFAATSTYQVDITKSAQENAAKIQEQCGLPQGADVVIEATGVESSVQTGMHVLKRGGSYIQVGLGKPIVAFPLVIMSEKEITMKGCFRYGPGAFALALSLLERKKVDLKPLITKVVPFDRVTDAWETARRGEGIKTLIQVQSM